MATQAKEHRPIAQRQTAPLEAFITINELANMLRITRPGILGLIKKGILPKGIKLGKSRRWPLSEIQECLHSLATA